jgi:hypothetical protein
MSDMADMCIDVMFSNDQDYFPESYWGPSPVTCNRCGEKNLWWYQSVRTGKWFLVDGCTRRHVCRIDPKKEFDNLDALDKDGVPHEVAPRVP